MAAIQTRTDTLSDLYQSLLEQVNNPRKTWYKHGVCIGYETYASHPNEGVHPNTGVIEVTLYNTTIASITPDSIIIRTGGYKTHATKDRLNQLLPAPYRIFQHRKQWYLYNHETHTEVPFVEGMIVPPLPYEPVTGFNPSPSEGEPYFTTDKNPS